MITTRTWWQIGADAVLLILAVLAVLGFLRTQNVVWGIRDPGLEAVLTSVKSPDDKVLGPGGALPWQAPDLMLSWIDPWSAPGGPVVLRPEVPRADEMAAFELLGLQTKAGLPAVQDWAGWLADLDRREPGVVPLAVSAKSDAELAALLVWMTEALSGPEALEAAFETSSGDPAALVPAWQESVKTLRAWAAQGRLAPNWWDYSDTDVADAVAEGRARYGLTWSGLHFPRTVEGIQKQSFRVPPSSPGRLSFSVVGRWLSLSRGGGWGSSSLVDEHAKAAFSVSTSQVWLRERGMLLATDLPAVNQESKALAFARLAAGTWVAAPPPGADLSRWKTLFETLRTELRK